MDQEKVQSEIRQSEISLQPFLNKKGTKKYTLSLDENMMNRLLSDNNIDIINYIKQLKNKLV